MSYSAMKWARSQPLPTAEKFVLFIMADCAREGDEVAFPSLKTLMADTGLSERTIQRARKALIQHGLITKEPRYGQSGFRLCTDVTVTGAHRPTPKNDRVASKPDTVTPPSSCHPVTVTPQPVTVTPQTDTVTPPPNHPLTTTNHHSPSVSPSPPPHAKRGSRLPDDWQPTEKLVAYATERGLSPERQAEDFRDYWHGATGKNAIKCDWAAAFRTWCRKAQDYQRERQQRLDHRHDSKIIPLRRLSPAELGRQTSIDRLEQKYGR